MLVEHWRQGTLYIYFNSLPKELLVSKVFGEVYKHQLG